MKTDQQFVEQIIKHQKNRKIIGFIFLIISLTFFGFLVYLISLLYPKGFNGMPFISANTFFKVGEKLEESHLQSIQNLMDISYFLGSKVGISLLSTALCGTSFLILAFKSFLGDRRNRIIISLYEKSQSSNILKNTN